MSDAARKTRGLSTRSAATPRAANDDLDWIEIKNVMDPSADEALGLGSDGDYRH